MAGIGALPPETMNWSKLHWCSVESGWERRKFWKSNLIPSKGKYEKFQRVRMKLIYCHLSWQILSLHLFIVSWHEPTESYVDG